MNKREARKLALSIAISLVEREIDSPTGLTCLNDYTLSTRAQADREALAEALDHIAEELGRKLYRFQNGDRS